MAAIIAQLAQAGAWVSDRSSLNQTRHDLGFTELTDDDVVAIRGESIGPPAADNPAPDGAPGQKHGDERRSAGPGVW
jgi:hypothetical protein